jgi:hypothetical protein
MGASPQSGVYSLLGQYRAVPIQPAPEAGAEQAPQSDVYSLLKQHGAIAATSQPTGQPAAQPPIFGNSVVDALISGIPALKAVELSPGGPGVLSGIGKGALQTVGSVSKLINKIPVVGEKLAPTAGINALEQLSTPQNTPEKIGAGAEQGAEALLLGAVAPEAVPFEGAAGTLGNIAVQGGVGALSNAMHGGSPLAGAAVGAGGEGLLQGMRAAAKPLVNSALGFGVKSKEFGRDPGQFILDETKGIRPKTLGPEVRTLIDARKNALEAKAAADPNVKVPLTPVRQFLLDLMEANHKQNHFDDDPYIEKLWDRVSVNQNTGEPFPDAVSGERALDLKRGIGKLVPESAWKEGAGTPLAIIAKRAQDVLGDSITQAVPGAEEENRFLSNMIEAERRLKITRRSMGPGERAIDRVTRPTGALAGAILGGQAGGVPGAIATIAVQEALRSPTVKLLAGRAMYAAPPIGAPIVKGIGLPLSAFATQNQPER